MTTTTARRWMTAAMICAARVAVDWMLPDCLQCVLPVEPYIDHALCVVGAMLSR